MFCSCKNVEVIETSRSNSSIRTMSSIKEQKEEEIKLKPRTAPYLLINKPKMVRRDALTCAETQEIQKCFCLLTFIRRYPYLLLRRRTILQWRC